MPTARPILLLCTYPDFNRRLPPLNLPHSCATKSLTSKWFCWRCRMAMCSLWLMISYHIAWYYTAPIFLLPLLPIPILPSNSRHSWKPVPIFTSGRITWMKESFRNAPSKAFCSGLTQPRCSLSPCASKMFKPGERHSKIIQLAEEVEKMV